MENIFHRVSIRKYEDKPVEKEKILQILKAVARADFVQFNFCHVTLLLTVRCFGVIHCVGSEAIITVRRLEKRIKGLVTGKDGWKRFKIRHIRMCETFCGKIHCRGGRSPGGMLGKICTGCKKQLRDGLRAAVF